MTYKEEVRDLFSVPDDYYLAHCISGDYALGAGIAVEFNKRFDMRRKLKEDYSDYWSDMKNFGYQGECILIDKVLNLLTKERYFHKPTYVSMRDSLKCMKIVCRANGIKKVAMPLIGCGLDRLKWDKVSAMIQEIFANEDIEILVCRQ